MGLDNVVGLIRNLMHLSANVGDFGDEGSVPSLWSQLPKIIVVGGQVRSVLLTRKLILHCEFIILCVSERADFHLIAQRKLC